MHILPRRMEYNEGRLIVKVDDTGEEKKIIAGEVSVRGLYGYV